MHINVGLNSLTLLSLSMQWRVDLARESRVKQMTGHPGFWTGTSLTSHVDIICEAWSTLCESGELLGL